MDSFKHYLIEQEKQQELTEICLQLIDDFLDENYEIIDSDSEHENAEEILNIVVEHYLQNEESEDLYEELAEVLLDESIGSAIATARYGKPSRALRKDVTKREVYHQNLVKKQLKNRNLYSQVTTASGTDTIPTYRKQEQEHIRKTTTGAYGRGIRGYLEKKKSESEIEKSRDKYEKAQQELRISRERIGYAKGRRTRMEKKRAGLGYKIDYAMKHPVKTVLKTTGKILKKGIKALT